MSGKAGKIGLEKKSLEVMQAALQREVEEKLRAVVALREHVHELMTLEREADLQHQRHEAKALRAEIANLVQTNRVVHETLLHLEEIVVVLLKDLDSQAD